MKKTILAVAVVLGISVTGFSQTKEALVMDETTGQQMELVIENNNVTVIPEEEIIIQSNGTDKFIALKSNGEYIGTVYRSASKYDAATGLDLSMIKVRIKAVTTNETTTVKPTGEYNPGAY